MNILSKAGLLAVRCCFLSRIASGDPLTRQLSATEAEMPRRCQPVRQDRKRLPARSTNAAPHPDAFVSVVVRLPESPSVADDSVVAAQRAKPRQQMQGNYRFTVVFGVWQCDKENHGWREGPPLTVAC